MKRTENLKAYDADLRGLAIVAERSAHRATPLARRKSDKSGAVGPKFALAWALLAYTDGVGYHTLNLQPTLALLRKRARQLKPRSSFSLLSAKSCSPRGIITTPA